MNINGFLSYLAITLIILSVVTLVTAITMYNSYDEFPRVGSGMTSIYGGVKHLLLKHYYFLYDGDRLSFEARVSNGPYRVSINIKGLFSGVEISWQGEFNGSVPKLPIFIPINNDWYKVSVEFTSLNNDSDMDVEFYLNVYEDIRTGVVENAYALSTYLTVLLVPMFIALYILSRRSVTLRLFNWEITSLYKWLVSPLALVIFIDVFQEFASTLVEEMYTPSIPAMDGYDDIRPTGFAIYEAIFSGVMHDRLILLIMIFAILINLLNVSYPLDRKFQRIYYSIGLDNKRLYFFKWLSGYILLILPYVLAKLYTTAVIIGPSNVFNPAYVDGLLARVLYDMYVAIYFHTIMFLISITF